MTRKPGFDLAAELAKPSFTPGQRDAPALADLVAGSDEAVATRAAPALASLKDAGRKAIVEKLGASRDAGDAGDGGRDGANARLVGVLGLLARAGDREARALLVEKVRDPATRVRKAAASALGKLDAADDVRTALLARWDANDVAADERRVLVEALGKLGGDDALARLRAIDAGGDAELARRRDRALLMADRSAKRDETSQIAIDVAPPKPLVLRLGTKAGLAPLLVEELASIGIAGKALVDREVEVQWAEPLARLFESHLWATIAIRVPLETREGVAIESPYLAKALVAKIVSSDVRQLLRAWTRGPIRWRLGFATGHKRAVVWNVARDVTAAAPELVNDPTATTWDILVDDAASELALVPRRIDDPRFRWRVAEVPAASQPSVAAALVWVAGIRETDRVWDPFCGSAVELCERARGKYKRLVGSDVDDAALAAARANVDAAKAAIEITKGDAHTFSPGEIDLVITNPPLGSRVHVDAAALLVETLPNIVKHLVSGGRLVWITPAFRKTTPVCEQLGLRRVRSIPLDLGGVRGHLERWDK